MNTFNFWLLLHYFFFFFNNLQEFLEKKIFFPVLTQAVCDSYSWFYLEDNTKRNINSEVKKNVNIGGYDFISAEYLSVIFIDIHTCMSSAVKFDAVFLIF